jgi:hypothetical protein
MKCSFPAILAALVISAPFAARGQNTVLLMDSDPGDYIGGGDNYYYTPGEGSFTASQNYDGGVSITFSNGSDSWSLDFAAPDAIPLQMQAYPNATRFPFQDPDEPGLSVSGQGRGCNTLTGEFEVKQIVYGPIISFHATFVQHCEGFGPALHGEILYNSSDPLPPKDHITSALTAFATRNQFFQYQISASNDPVSFSATDLPAGLSLDSSSGLISGMPSVEGTFSIQLTATGTDGTASATLSLAIDPPGQSTGPYTALFMRSESGDYIGGGQSYFYTPFDGNFVAYGVPGGSSIFFYFSSFSEFDYWNVSLSAPSFSRLGIGVYFGATRFASSSNPGIDVTGEGRGCNEAAGSFEVKELAYNGNKLAAGRATFEQHCDGGPALHGEAWFYSTNAITSFPAPMTNRDEAFSYQIIGNNQPTFYGASALPPGLSVAPTSGLITGTPTVAGRFSVPVTASGPSTTASGRLDLLILPPTADAPIISSAPSASETVDQPFSYQITATKSPTQFSATGLPPGISVDTTTGLLSGIPTITGTFDALIYATNASGTGGSSLTISIYPPIPAITSLNHATAFMGRAFEFQVTASNEPTSYSASNLPSGLTIGSTDGLISGVADTVGTYLATVRAGNGSGVGFQSFTFTVTPAPPEITSPATAIGSLDKNFSYLIVADGIPTSFGATGLPPGLHVDSTNGLITGTPTAIGTFDVTISATNEFGIGTAPLSITIREEANSLLNVSTRLSVGADDGVLIGGFIVTGSYPKKVLIRGIGPSLGAYGVAGTLADPVLELHDASGATLATNDNWHDSQEAEIMATIPPADDLESAIVTTLASDSSYTAILGGKDNATGVGLLEIYDLDVLADSQMANISTRGQVGTLNDVMVAGFVIGGVNGAGTVLVRAIGPSLEKVGLDGLLEDPVLELHNVDGDTIAGNENWRDTQPDEIVATGLAPGDDREAAILATESAGPYTAIVRGANNSLGLALVEVYRLP